MKTALAIFNAALSGRGPFAVATITINCEAMWTGRPAEANAQREVCERRKPRTKAALGHYPDLSRVLAEGVGFAGRMRAGSALRGVGFRLSVESIGRGFAPHGELKL